MNNARSVTSHQLFMLFFVLFVGATMAFGGNHIAGRNTWTSIIISTISAAVIYSLLHLLFAMFQGEDIFFIHQKVYGIKLGRLVNYIYGALAIASASFAILMLAVFIHTVSLNKTPLWVLVFMITFVCFTAAVGNRNALAKFSQIAGFFVFIILVVSLCLNISDINGENMLPLFGIGLDKILYNSLLTLILPFMEGFFIMGSYYRGEKKNLKILLSCLLTSGIFILLSAIRNLLVFGYPAIKGLFYPSYSALSLINFGEFFQREEVLVSIVFALCYILKAGILMNFAAHTLPFKKYLSSLWVAALLTLPTVFFLKNTMVLFQMILIYIHILVFPLIILPIITLIVAKVRRRKQWN